MAEIMSHEDGFERTMRLRWSRNGRLQQCWQKKVTVMRTIASKQRACYSFETQWRDIPTEGDEQK